MKFHYSSMYIDETISDFEEIEKKVDLASIELYLDTNICIYLRDFYKEPSSTVKDDSLWSELKKLLRNIEVNNLLVDYSFGVEEACRNKSNFEINYEKAFDMTKSIKSLFDMNFLQMLEHSKLVKFDSQLKDATQKQCTKIDSLESSSRFQKLLFINYACLIKMYLLEKNRGTKSNQQLMIEFLDFIENEVDIFSTSIIIFSHYYFSGSDFAKKLIHKSKKIIEEKVHSFWNAAIDLTFPALISQQFLKSKTIPVFVTADERLALIFDSMKIRAMIMDNEKPAYPPFVEVDLSRTGWSPEDLTAIDKHYNEIMERRKTKYIFNQFNEDKILQNLRELCYKLENEYKSTL